MENTEEYILIGQYFSSEETESIRERFKESDIEFLINSHGPNFELEGKYYEIKVKSGDTPKAQEIVKREREAFLATKTKCPKCGQSSPGKIIKKNLLERIFYVGTELVECQVCGSKYGI